jgi:hypothetical protein
MAMAKPDNTNAASEPIRSAEQKAREQRLAKALRENLRRRKAPAASPAGEPENDGR